MDDLLLSFSLSLFPFFFRFLPYRSACLSFFALLLSSRIPPSCHPRREEKTRALFDCVAAAGNTRNFGTETVRAHRPIAIKTRYRCSSSRSVSLFCFFLYYRGSVVPHLIEIPDREECYGARSEGKHRRRDSVITRDRYFL